MTDNPIWKAHPYIRKMVKRSVWFTLRSAARILSMVPGSQRMVVLPGPPSYVGQGGDGLTTVHNASFMYEPDFQLAYRRGVEAAGWDYGIYWRIHVALWAASNAVEIPGDFVELGTGRGMVLSSILRDLDWGNADKRVWLIDTFKPGKPDKLTGVQEGPQSPYYAANAEAVRQNFAQWPKVHVVEGLVPDVLSKIPVETVSFLHIDLNMPDPEVAGLRHFWPLLSHGAMVLLDDYANWGREDQYRAINGIADEIGVSVLSLPTGQGLILNV